MGIWTTLRQLATSQLRASRETQWPAMDEQNWTLGQCFIIICQMPYHGQGIHSLGSICLSFAILLPAVMLFLVGTSSNGQWHVVERHIHNFLIMFDGEEVLKGLDVREFCNPTIQEGCEVEDRCRMDKRGTLHSSMRQLLTHQLLNDFGVVIHGQKFQICLWGLDGC